MSLNPLLYYGKYPLEIPSIQKLMMILAFKEVLEEYKYKTEIEYLKKYEKDYEGGEGLNDKVC